MGIDFLTTVSSICNNEGGWIPTTLFFSAIIAVACMILFNKNTPTFAETITRVTGWPLVTTRNTITVLIGVALVTGYLFKGEYRCTTIMQAEDGTLSKFPSSVSHVVRLGERVIRMPRDGGGYTYFVEMRSSADDQ